MLIEYQPEHAEYRNAVQSFTETIVRPVLREFSMDHPLDHDELHRLWDKLSGHGFIDEIPRNEEDDIDWLAVGILMEEIARVNGALAFLTVEGLIMPAMTAEVLAPSQRETYAHLFAPGAFMSGAFSEPGAGSNPTEITTKAVRTPEGWTISGTKLWSSGASHSDSVLVACRVPEEDTTRPSIGLFLVDRSQSPYATTDYDMLGLRGHTIAEVHFDDVTVPADARVGQGSGQALIQLTLQKARCYLAINAVGVAQRALDLAVEYSKTREQFGRHIGQFQLVQHLLAGMATGVHLGRLAAFRALNILQAGGAATIETSIAKSYCTEMAQRVTSDAIQIHGAIGLSADSEVQRLFRDARMMTIPDGTTQIHELVIGRALTGLNALV